MPYRRVYISVLGVGGVGRAFLFQLSALIKRLAHEWTSVDVILVYIATSRKCLISRDFTGLLAPIVNHDWDADQYAEAVLSALQRSQTEPLDLVAGIDDYFQDAPGRVIIIDNTSEQSVADCYNAWLRARMTVVTPNKKAFCTNDRGWKYLQHAMSGQISPRSYLFHEATVGAGLPLLSTVTELVRTGDKIRRIEGVFSGTMSFLFNTFAPASATAASKGLKWSELINVAVQQGYTEPDPRDDLDGQDVATKLSILARAVLSWEIDKCPVSVEGVIPAELKSSNSKDEFLRRLPEFDDEMDQMKFDAIGQGKVLRYVGSLDVENKALSVGVRRFHKSHPIAQLKASQKSISIYTERYGESALILQGGSADVNVTAMTVAGDLLKAIDRLN